MKTVQLFLLACSVFLASVSRLDAQLLGMWGDKADLPGTFRYGAAGFSIGGKIYVGTGISSSSGVKDFWEYDPVTDTWTQKADFGGAARGFAVGFAINGKGYIGTGVSSAGSFPTVFKDFWEYDPATNVWTQKADFGGGLRTGATGFAVGGKGYIGTGHYNGYQNDFWEYNPVTDAWTQKANFPGGARWVAAGTSLGDRGYIGTGTTGSLGNQGSIYNDFWEYNPTNNTWSQKASCGGAPRQQAAVFAFGTKIYLGTGLTSNGVLVADFWAYEVSTNTWTQIAAPTSTHAAVGISTGYSGYICTGNGTGKKISQYFPYPIHTLPLYDDPFCVGDTVLVQYLANAPFATNNVFTVQLSDANGNFANAISIGSLQSQYDGTITCVIPSGVAQGFNYRVRVVSSSPAAFSNNNNGTDFAIYQLRPYYPDADEDTYGTDDNTIIGCINAPFGYAEQGGDCNDNNPNIHPNVPDMACNGIDENCNPADDTVSFALYVSRGCKNSILYAYNQLGGIGPFRYRLNNGPWKTSPYFTISQNGTFTYTVRDVPSGCMASQTVTITQHTPVIVSMTKTNVTCHGAYDGTASAIANGGDAPYTYYWSNGQTTATAANLGPGTYTVTVYDAFGCTKTQKATITSPNPMSLYMSGAQLLPNGNYRVTMTAVGGVSPRKFQYCNPDNSDCSAYKTGGVFIVPMGNYIFRVKDANDCTYALFVSVPPFLKNEADERMGNPETSSLQVWPNPSATGEFTVQLPDFEEERPAEAVVMDFFGRVVHSQKLGCVAGETCQVDLTHLPGGSYLMSLILNESTVRTTRLEIVK